MRRNKIFIGLGIFFAVLLLFQLFIAPKQSRIAVVHRIIDGDTVEIDSGQRVRLIGVDTPEFHDPERNAANARRLGISEALYATYAKEASEFLKDLVLHKPVRLEYDEANQKDKHRDRYGRLLAYLWLESPFVEPIPEWAVLDESTEDSYKLSLNASLIRAGYSFAYKRFPFKYKVPYEHHEMDARTQKRGFWQGQKRSIIEDAQLAV